MKVWLTEIYKNSTKKEFRKFNDLLNDFLHDSEKELWTDFEKLREFTYNDANIKKFIKGELGSNLMFKYKSRSLTTDLENICNIAIFTTRDMLSKKLGNQKDLYDFVEDLIDYKKCQTREIFKLVVNMKKNFRYNIPKFIAMKDSITDKIDLKNLKFKSSTELNFKLNKTQVDQIENYNNLFSTTLEGISRTLTRVYFKKLLRSVDGKQNIENISLDTNRRWGGEVIGI